METVHNPMHHRESHPTDEVRVLGGEGMEWTVPQAYRSIIAALRFETTGVQEYFGGVQQVPPVGARPGEPASFGSQGFSEAARHTLNGGDRRRGVASL
jgi:hypothetical protein